MSNAKGLACGAAAFGLWGLLPVYWKMLAAVPAFAQAQNTVADAPKNVTAQDAQETANADDPDAIIVTAAAPRVPPALVAQLKPGGRLAIPLGAAEGPQELALLEKNADGETEIRPVLPVRFVPLTGGCG